VTGCRKKNRRPRHRNDGRDNETKTGLRNPTQFCAPSASSYDRYGFFDPIAELYPMLIDTYSIPERPFDRRGC
jgi:hypothetical protein